VSVLMLDSALLENMMQCDIIMVYVCVSIFAITYGILFQHCILDVAPLIQSLGTICNLFGYIYFPSVVSPRHALRKSTQLT
jgi:ABC-type glucose/galactose transport system permease subunit